MRAGKLLFLVVLIGLGLGQSLHAGGGGNAASPARAFFLLR